MARVLVPPPLSAQMELTSNLYVPTSALKRPAHVRSPIPVTWYNTGYSESDSTERQY